MVTWHIVWPECKEREREKARVVSDDERERRRPRLASPRAVVAHLADVHEAVAYRLLRIRQPVALVPHDERGAPLERPLVDRDRVVHDLHAHYLPHAMRRRREPLARGVERRVMEKVDVIRRALAPERVVRLGADEDDGADAERGRASRDRPDVVLLRDVVHDEVAPRRFGVVVGGGGRRRRRRLGGGRTNQIFVVAIRRVSSARRRRRRVVVVVGSPRRRAREDRREEHRRRGARGSPESAAR
eukprot:30414-Pelagococcus_subviridis.AAC.15